MKKFLCVVSSLLILFSWITVAQKVTVYAVVGNVNNVPQITYVNPDLDPLLIWQWELQTFSFWMMDPESETIYYTISTDNWVVSPVNWSVQWSWSINFFYLAPSGFSDFTKIYITLNDWSNFIVKEISVFVY